MKAHLFAASVLLASATGAFAQEAEQPAQDATAAAAQAEDGDEQEEPSAEDQEVVCRTQRVTGSLTRRNRVCQTRAQWDAQENNTQRGLREFNRDAAGGQAIQNNPGMGGPGR